MKNVGAVTHSSKTKRRAIGYLRWYPRAWRDRYGEEFVAHLEAELEERPQSFARSANIALHGLTTRFKLQTSVRWISGAALTLFLVLALIAGVLSFENRSIGAPFRIDNGGASGLQVTTKSVTNFGYRLNNHTMKRIRLTSVSAVAFRSYAVPRVVRVGVTGNPNSFVSELPGSVHGLLPVFGHSRLLGNDRLLVVSFATPEADRLYAVGGLRITYLLSGATHVTTISLKQSPDLMCVRARTSSYSVSQTCRHDMAVAWALAGFYYPVDDRQSPEQREAFITTNAALGFEKGSGQTKSSISVVRQWAASLFSSRGRWQILQVTATPTNITLGDAKHVLLFHFKMRQRSSGAMTTVCVQNGAHTSGGGGFSVALVACG